MSRLRAGRERLADCGTADPNTVVK